MYNRESILHNLNAENYYVDKHSLDLFLNDWKIDSIYEDEAGLEFYDDLSLDKIKKGIALKSQGYSDDQIIAKLNKMEAKVEKSADSVQPIMVTDYLEEVGINESAETAEENVVTDLTPQQDKTFTLDVTSKTLQMLAEAVAKKISDDITNSDMAKSLIEAGGYKRDNEIMAKQIEELLKHNNELSQRIEQLESHPSRSFWKRIWGQK